MNFFCFWFLKAWGLHPLRIGSAPLRVRSSPSSLKDNLSLPINHSLSLFLGSNRAEGIVIKPMKNIVVETAFGEKERVILKIKGPEFDETRNQKGTKKKGAGKIQIIIPKMYCICLS